VSTVFVDVSGQAETPDCQLPSKKKLWENPIPALLDDEGADWNCQEADNRAESVDCIGDAGIPELPTHRSPV
jgi:hypothetical protein